MIDDDYHLCYRTSREAALQRRPTLRRCQRKTSPPLFHFSHVAWSQFFLLTLFFHDTIMSRYTHIVYSFLSYFISFSLVLCTACIFTGCIDDRSIALCFSCRCICIRTIEIRYKYSDLSSKKVMKGKQRLASKPYTRLNTQSSSTPAHSRSFRRLRDVRTVIGRVQD